MVKISIDLRSSDESLVPKELLEAVTSGCLQALKRLERLGDAIEVFRITFVCFNGSLVPGPLFRIYFRDPLGKECSHEFDYRFIKSESSILSEVEIADAICTYLPEHIIKHLKQCAITVKLAQVELDELKLEKK